MNGRGTLITFIKSCQIESRAEFKTTRLLRLSDGDCREECVLGRRRIRRIALEQNLAAPAMKEGVAPVFPRFIGKGEGLYFSMLGAGGESDLPSRFIAAAE
jgi:hypothetical protein